MFYTVFVVSYFGSCEVNYPTYVTSRALRWPFNVYYLYGVDRLLIRVSVTYIGLFTSQLPILKLILKREVRSRHKILYRFLILRCIPPIIAVSCDFGLISIFDFVFSDVSTLKFDKRRVRPALVCIRPNLIPARKILKLMFLFFKAENNFCSDFLLSTKFCFQAENKTHLPIHILGPSPNGK